jgi:hypothetical protein
MMESLREREINPLVFAPIVIVILLALGYFFWLKPKMEADAALRNFNTPEAQAKRDPDQRAHTDDQKKLLEELRAKEQHSSAVTGTATRRHRD